MFRTGSIKVNQCSQQVSTRITWHIGITQSISASVDSCLTQQWVRSNKSPPTSSANHRPVYPRYGSKKTDLGGIGIEFDIDFTYRRHPPTPHHHRHRTPHFSQITDRNVFIFIIYLLISAGWAKALNLLSWQPNIWPLNSDVGKGGTHGCPF